VCGENMVFKHIFAENHANVRPAKTKDREKETRKVFFCASSFAWRAHTQGRAGAVHQGVHQVQAGGLRRHPGLHGSHRAQGMLLSNELVF
jgi:hypothetical protein